MAHFRVFFLMTAGLLLQLSRFTRIVFNQRTPFAFILCSDKPPRDDVPYAPLLPNNKSLGWTNAASVQGMVFTV